MVSLWRTTKFCSGKSRQHPILTPEGRHRSGRNRRCTMTLTMIAARSLRGALLAVATLSVAFPASVAAGVHQSACLTNTDRARANQEPRSAQIRYSGPGLLRIVRQIGGAERAVLSSSSIAQPAALEQRTRPGQLSDRALRERIARYRVSPTASQHQASLPTGTRTLCSD